MEAHEKREADLTEENGAAAAGPGVEGGTTAAPETDSPDMVDGVDPPRESDTAGDDPVVGEVDENDGQSTVESRDSPDAGFESELAEAQCAAQDNLDRALRLQAELENVRRRQERDLEKAHKFAIERFVSELLPVKDSLELGLDAAGAESATATSIAEGVELTLRLLEQALEKFGVSAVDPAGEAFDPELHQAMTMQESETADSGTVLTVVQKGYVLNERLVRPAMVIVAK